MSNPPTEEELEAAGEQFRQLAEAREKLPDDQREVFDLIIQADVRVSLETVNEMIDELDRAETVGPLLNPSAWQGDAFDKTNTALERLRALRDFKEKLNGIE